MNYELFPANNFEFPECYLSSWLFKNDTEKKKKNISIEIGP